jgi:transcriptional regulator with XRE-family HTH domain
LTLRALAARTHISRSALSRYFTGQAMPSRQIVDRLARTCGGDPDALQALWERAAVARQRLRFSHLTGPGTGPLDAAAAPALAGAQVAVIPPLPRHQAVLDVIRRRRKAILLAASAVAGVLALLVAIGGFAYRQPLTRDAVRAAQSLPDLPAGGTFRARDQGPVPPAPPAEVSPATNPSPRPRPSASSSPRRRPPGASRPSPKPTGTATPAPPASPSPKPPNGPESIPGSLTFKSRFTANSCIDSLGGGEHPAYTNAPCDPSNQNQRWNVAVGSKPSQGRQELVTLTNVATGSCLDGDHSDDGNAWVQGCNDGAFQLWEVFLLRASNEDDQVVTVFKSWGAWQQDRKHVCLYADAGSVSLKLRTCDATNARQQWY